MSLNTDDTLLCTDDTLLWYEHLVSVVFNEPFTEEEKELVNQKDEPKLYKAKSRPED